MTAQRKKTVTRTRSRKTAKTVVATRQKTAKKQESPPPVPSEDILAMIHELEELTGKVKDAETEIVRTKELQEDLNENLEEQMKIKEESDAKVQALTAERNGLAETVAGLDRDIAALQKEVDILAKGIEKAEALNGDLCRKRDDLEETVADLSEKNKAMSDAVKKISVEIEKLKETRKELTS